MGWPWLIPRHSTYSNCHHLKTHLMSNTYFPKNRKTGRVPSMFPQISPHFAHKFPSSSNLQVANLSAANELEPLFSPSPQLGAVPQSTRRPGAASPGPGTPGPGTPGPGTPQLAGPSPLQRVSKLKALKAGLRWFLLIFGGSQWFKSIQKWTLLRLFLS